MKRTYISPEVTVFVCTSHCLMASSSETTTIHNDNTGGDDGQGGYDPGNSLSRDNGSSGNGLWDKVW